MCSVTADIHSVGSDTIIPTHEGEVDVIEKKTKKNQKTKKHPNILCFLLLRWHVLDEVPISWGLLREEKTKQTKNNPGWA